jgi:predicted secreted Zn-dependent protease
VAGAPRRPLSALAFIGAILAGLSVALLALMLGGSGGFLFPAPTATPGRQVADQTEATARPTRTLPPPRTPGDRPTATASPTAGDTATPFPSLTPLPTWTPEDTATERPPYEARPTLVRYYEPLPTSTPWPSVRSLEVRIHRQFYYIGGATIFELQNALWVGSEDVGSGDIHAIATTASEFRLQTQFVQSGQTCVVPNFTVYLNLTYTYPQWQPTSPPDPAAVAEWQRFIAYDIDHEETHGEISFECAIELVEDIRAFQPGADCQQASATYDRMMSEITRACESRQAAYDRRQGAVTFPLGEAVPSQTPTGTGTPGTGTPGAGTGTPRP